VKAVLVLFLFLHWFVPGWFFCVIFQGLVYVEGFVGSYYFMQLVLLMSFFFFLFGVNGGWGMLSGNVVSGSSNFMFYRAI